MSADIVAADLHAQRGIAAVEHTHQLNHAFTRYDHRMIGQGLFQRHRANRQAVAVGRHGAQFAAFGFKQHAVQVIANVLVSHRKLRRLDQALHGRLRQGKFNFALPVIKVGEIRCWQRREREAAATGTHQHTLAFQLYRNLCAFRQAAADIKKFTRRNGCCSRFVRLNQRNARDHFHFQIGTGQRQRAIGNLKEQVAKNR